MTNNLAENENIDNENIDNKNIDNENINNSDDIQDDIQDDTPQISEAEELARKGGWKPRGEWDGDPDDWTSPKRFNQTRDIIEANKSLRSNQDRMQHNFDSRLTNLQKLSEQRLEAEITTLKDKRDNAASEADMPAYNEANKQIDELQKTDIKPTERQNNPQELMAGIVGHPSTQAFINENTWIKDGSTAKGMYGQKIFVDWIAANGNNPNAILEEGLNLVKESVNREFPAINPNRQNNQSMSERGNGSRRSVSSNSLTINDLTREEKNIFDEMGNTWDSEKDFLQAVADSRKGE